MMEKPCLTKEEFVQALNFIKERDEAQTKIGELFENEFEDSIFWPYSKWQAWGVQLLEKIMRDTENNWISYFIYELDYGTGYQDGYITDVDGSNIKMATAEDLYDFLVKEYFSE